MLRRLFASLAALTLALPALALWAVGVSLVGLHTRLDETVARLLRDAGLAPKVLPVANKVDDPGWEAHGLEAASLGFGEPVLCSATTGYGVRRMSEAVWERMAGIERAAKPENPEIGRAHV